ncbi:hypothetical protein EJB05_48788, partial [Eragrostis curvula]
MANAVLLLLAVVVSTLSLLPSASLAAMTQDFCVADLTMSETPVGFPCKPEASVTAADFHNAGLAAAGPVLDPFKTGLATALVHHFPGLNGLGLGATRVCDDYSAMVASRPLVCYGDHSAKTALDLGVGHSAKTATRLRH